MAKVMTLRIPDLEVRGSSLARCVVSLDPVYMQGVGDPGLVGYVSFVLCLLERENKRNQPH